MNLTIFTKPLIRTADFLSKLPFKKTEFYRRLRVESEFPKPIKAGRRMNLYQATDAEIYLAKLAQQGGVSK